MSLQKIKTTKFKENRYRIMRKILLLFVVLSCKYNVHSQLGVNIHPLLSNQTLKAASSGYLYTNRGVVENYNRRNQGDTLELPFFDDFTSSLVYPDMRLWMDSLVFINNTFPNSPPSYGVATFDNLDKWGNPYTERFSYNNFQAWDTLTSRPINLKSYTVGANKRDYLLSDSIYLSFFFQGGGLGDRPEANDSFVLQFKKRNGRWYNVWNASQIGSGDFKQVLVGVLDSNYLWDAFQFRFLNYTTAMGNLNQIHLDYVRLNANRNANDTIIRDVAISKSPTSLLKYYYSMPYTHFVADSTNQKATQHTIGVRNNDIDVINTQFQFESYYKGSQIALYPFTSSSRNILPLSDSVENFNSFGLGSFPQNEYLQIKNVYKIVPQAGNTTPSSYNSIGNNDEYVFYQNFKNYYSYDDGTAEGGIGLNYEGLPAGRGTFAIKYNLTKSDTFSGLAVYFNQSMENVNLRPFKLCVWGTLKEGSMEDEPIYEYSVLAPAYTDSINGFHYFVFDTTIVLPKGDFYVGWSQTSIFNLNVGYDNNYRLDGKEQRNTNILYNLLGVWQYADSEIKGVPMIRPLIGKYSDWGLGLKEVKSKQTIYKVYPNPSKGTFKIYSESNRVGDFTIYTMNGRIALAGTFQNNNDIDISDLPSGIYILRIKSDNDIQTERLIKE